MPPVYLTGGAGTHIDKKINNVFTFYLLNEKRKMGIITRVVS